MRGRYDVAFPDGYVCTYLAVSTTSYYRASVAPGVAATYTSRERAICHQENDYYSSLTFILYVFTYAHIAVAITALDLLPLVPTTIRLLAKRIRFCATRRLYCMEPGAQSSADLVGALDEMPLLMLLGLCL